jgi:predicted phosphodiesterase
MGHRHVPWSIKINNTVLVNAGTVSCLRTRGRFGNSFNLISIDEENIYIEEIKVDGKKGMLTGYKTKSILKT